MANVLMYSPLTPRHAARPKTLRPTPQHFLALPEQQTTPRLHKLCVNLSISLVQALAELLGSSEFGRRRLFLDKLKNAVDGAVDWVEGAVDTVVTTAESVVKEVESAVKSVTSWLDDLRSDVEYVPLCPPLSAHGLPRALCDCIQRAQVPHPACYDV